MSISITEAVPASILQAAKGNIVGGRTLSMPHSTQSGAVSKPESFVSSTQTNVHHNLHEDPSWPLGSEVVTAANTTISAQPPSILSSSNTWRWQSTKEVKPSKISLRSIYRLARSLKAEKGKWNMLAEVTDRIRLALHQMKLLEEVQAEREVAKGEHDKARKNQGAEWKRMTPEQRKEWCNRQIAQDGEEDCTKDEARQEHGSSPVVASRVSLSLRQLDRKQMYQAWFKEWPNNESTITFRPPTPATCGIACRYSHPFPRAISSRTITLRL